MSWNDTTRKKYKRKIDRYPSDMSDKEWAIIEPLVPLPKHRGRPRTTNMRELINGALPVALPKGSTVQRYFTTWTDEGVLIKFNDAMVAACRTVS